MKKVIIISTSFRPNSNSDRLAKAFMEGAKESGNEVQYISLQNKTIQFCRGCLACQKLKHCVIKDDSNEIVSKMEKADVIVWASPIYYYEMSGQMKTLIDRANCLYSSDYQFRDVYGLFTAAEEDEEVPQKAIAGLQGWVDCFEKAKLVDTLFVGGVNLAGDIENNPGLEKAKALGSSIQ